MILNDVVAAVRQLSKDTNTLATLQRFTDAQLLGFANQALRRIALLRPDLFATMGEVTCTVDEVLQAAPTDSIRLMEVFRIKNGRAVREANREVLDQNHPDWTTDTAAAAVNWMRHPRNPNKFFIYPKAPASQILIVEYAQSPATYVGTDPVLLLPDSYFTSVVDCVMFLASSVDDEHVLSQRAALFQQSFTSSLQTNLESRVVTDLETGGHEKGKVP